MTTHSTIQLQKAYLNWLSKVDTSRAIAITITFKRTRNGDPISKEKADKASHVFCRMLNSKAFGNSFKKGLRQLTIIPVDEGGRGPGEKHPHKHFMVQVPEGWTISGWIEAVESIVEKIECFGGQAVVKQVWDDGWLKYMLKLRDKKSFADAVDIANMHVN